MHLHKRKGNPQVCESNHASFYCQLLGVLLNRLNEHLEHSGRLPESQCEFRKDRGIINMIFTARQLQEKCQEQNVAFYMTFVDHTKASDIVSRERLWKIMTKFGWPAKFIAMVRQFHDGLILFTKGTELTIFGQLKIPMKLI